MPDPYQLVMAAEVIGVASIVAGLTVWVRGWRARRPSRNGVRLVALGVLWTLLVPGTLGMIAAGLAR